jgi:hypothetical protein
LNRMISASSLFVNGLGTDVPSGPSTFSPAGKRERTRVMEQTPTR